MQLGELKMRTIFPIGILCISLVACHAQHSVNGSCTKDFEDSYSGVAIATEAGDSSFSIGHDCHIFVSGPEEYYQEVRAAWRNSPYKGALRPIHVDIEGKLRYRDQENLAPVIEVDEGFSISTNLDSTEVAQQFRLRMNRDAPEQN
ncbi:hypothetical protein [Pelagerythrobacter sp.]|uniref:hypothetical protein n=1 Tax=Pelagerythrobacter sp. TaxID=2800702 RepID=UPI0035B2F4BB